jgi:hypothetical protein
MNLLVDEENKGLDENDFLNLNECFFKGIKIIALNEDG